MPTYDYACNRCSRKEERVVPMVERDAQNCRVCGDPLTRLLSAPYGRVMFEGRVLKGGGPDRFTADVLGMHPKDLPDGLRTDGTKRDS